MSITKIDPTTMHNAEDRRPADPTDPGHPTDQALSRRFVELRIAAGLDVKTLAKRAGLDLDTLLALEAGSRGWVLSEIIAVTLGLGEELPNVFAPWNTLDPS